VSLWEGPRQNPTPPPKHSRLRYRSEHNRVTKLRALTRFEVLGLLGRFERIVLHGDDQVLSVVQVLDVQSAHEVDQCVGVAEKYVNCNEKVTTKLRLLAAGYVGRESL